MYTYGLFTMLYSRNEQNIGKQLYSNKKKYFLKDNQQRPTVKVLFFLNYKICVFLKMYNRTGLQSALFLYLGIYLLLVEVFWAVSYIISFNSDNKFWG